jgi:hypothetical protein
MENKRWNYPFFHISNDFFDIVFIFSKFLLTGFAGTALHLHRAGGNLKIPEVYGH